MSAKSAVSGGGKPGLDGNNKRSVPRAVSAAEWLDAQNPAHYTIQLSSSRRAKSARDFIRRHYLDSGAVYTAVESKGATWYAVFYGAYSSRAAALAAVNALPADLQAGEPWVRSINTVQAQVAGAHKHWAKLDSGLLR